MFPKTRHPQVMCPAQSPGLWIGCVLFCSVIRLPCTAQWTLKQGDHLGGPESREFSMEEEVADLKHEGDLLGEKFPIAGLEVEGATWKRPEGGLEGLRATPADSRKKNRDLSLATSRKCLLPTTCDLGRGPHPQMRPTVLANTLILASWDPPWAENPGTLG